MAGKYTIPVLLSVVVGGGPLLVSPGTAIAEIGAESAVAVTAKQPPWPDYPPRPRPREEEEEGEDGGGGGSGGGRGGGGGGGGGGGSGGGGGGGGSHIIHARLRNAAFDGHGVAGARHGRKDGRVSLVERASFNRGPNASGVTPAPGAPMSAAALAGGSLLAAGAASGLILVRRRRSSGAE